MPLFKTVHGDICPLGKFEINSGGYTADPVKVCLGCNFADNSVEEFDLTKICQSPAAYISPTDYASLKEEFLFQYKKNNQKPTRNEFWKFAKEKYPN